jgi:hypothetical protein
MNHESSVNDSELVQRFLDQELSAEERVHFVVRLGRDRALRHHVIELEQLALIVGRLPRPAVPDGFTASVLERISLTAPARPVWRRVSAAWRSVWDTLMAPRNLRWNLASAAAVCGIACLAVWGLLGAGPEPGVGNRDARGTALSTTPAPPPTTVLVRLVVLQPDARMVQVAGDFNGWNPARTPLEQLSSGAWTVTLPLTPGRYEYMFVVDGDRWVADPFAAEQNDDGFGSRNAVLEVRSSEAQS